MRDFVTSSMYFPRTSKMAAYSGYVEMGCESEEDSNSTTFSDDDCGKRSRIPQPYQNEPYCIDADNNESAEENADESPSTSIDRLHTSSWCSCGCCTPMPTPKECVCCKEMEKFENLLENVSCITEHPGFEPVCLNPYVLETAYYQYRQQYGQQIIDVNRRYRYTAYRQLTRFVWGYLGKTIRVVLPACAVSKIRNTFPSKDGQSVGYLEK